MFIKEYMLLHLQALMEDVEFYGWRIIWEYHAAWLQLLEQCQATWGDSTKKDKLRQPLVWSKTPQPQASHTQWGNSSAACPPTSGIHDQVWVFQSIVQAG